MTEAWGNLALANKVQSLLGENHPVAAVATISGNQSVVAGWGAQRQSDFEIGSISKGVTGLLYQDAVARGVVTAETVLGDLLPLAKGCPAAHVELGALSQHRSGLPRLAPARKPLRRNLRLWLQGRNPYGDTVEEMIQQAGTVTLDTTEPGYSNFGFELLGHAVARAQDVTYPELVEARLSSKLGLKSWYVPASSQDLRPDSLIGRTRHGRAREAWTGEALAPAGGIRSSIGDMAEFTRALIEERAVGLKALDPSADHTGGLRIGSAWFTLEHKNGAITWHNGGTGGFSTWLGTDREKKVGAVILSATSDSVDTVGFRLLIEQTVPGPR